MLLSIRCNGKIDAIGRIILPAEIREVLRIKEGDSMIITADTMNGEIKIKKTVKNCLICHTEHNLKEIRPDYFLCKHCIRELNNNI